jgi:hypothetical protein
MKIFLSYSSRDRPLVEPIHLALCWHDSAERVKATQRYHASPENRADDLGFRCARDVR